jgi:hypothetical protein
MEDFDDTTPKAFKTRVSSQDGLSGVKGDNTVGELGKQFELHPNQIIQFRWHPVKNTVGYFVKEGGSRAPRPLRGRSKDSTRNDRAVDPFRIT